MREVGYSEMGDSMPLTGQHEQRPAPAGEPRELLDKLKADLQAFPRPGQANLNSTATTQERSVYISAVLGWWNARVAAWDADGVLDPRENPVVNPAPAPVRGNFPVNVPGCGMGGAS